MKYITLTNTDLQATVDDCDYAYLNQFNWRLMKFSRKGFPTKMYAARTQRSNGRSVVVLMHREIIIAPKAVRVDHIDHDGLNNVRSNLRFSTNQQNGFNRRTRPGTFKGVRERTDYANPTKRWRAFIGYNGVVFLDSFVDPEKAAEAYDKAALLLYGEYACLNFPDKQYDLADMRMLLVSKGLLV